MKWIIEVWKSKSVFGEVRHSKHRKASKSKQSRYIEIDENRFGV